MLNKIVDFILNKIFVISKQPVLFKDLLEANLLMNENMLVDPAKLNFKFNYAGLYGIYSVFCGVCLLVFIAILHGFFVKTDFHFSVLATAITTSLVFVGFDVFRIWARKYISKKLIKEAWSVHFPYFAYEKYSKKVEEIYLEAKKNEIYKKDLEKYILEKLVETASEK